MDSSGLQVEQAFQDLSVIYCELASLLVLVSCQSGTRGMPQGDRIRAARHKSFPPLKNHLPLNLQADLVESYVIRLLQEDGGSGARLPRPISAAVYTALLPTIWALLNGQQPEKEPSSVLAATLDHAMRTTSGSGVKRLTVEFVGRLLLVRLFRRARPNSSLISTLSWREKLATPAILTHVMQVKGAGLKSGPCTSQKRFGRQGRTTLVRSR